MQRKQVLIIGKLVERADIPVIRDVVTGNSCIHTVM